MVIGAPAIYYLMNPPTQATPLYLAIAWACVVLSWSLIEIPHMAWGGEIARDERQRSQLFTLRGFFGMMGVAAIFALPLLPIFETQGYDRQSFHAMSIALIAALIVFGLITLAFAPRGERLSAPGGSPLAIFSGLRRSAPLRIFLLAQLTYAVGVGIFGPLFALYLSTELRLADKLAFLAACRA